MTYGDLMRINRKLDCVLHNQNTLAAMLIKMYDSKSTTPTYDMETMAKHIRDRVHDAQMAPPNTGAR